MEKISLTPRALVRRLLDGAKLATQKQHAESVGHTP